MHDIDRTLADTEYEYEYEYEPQSEYEAYDDGEYESDYGYEFENADDEYEYEFEGAFDEGEGVFDESEEMELAAELLSVSDDEELEYFLGKLIKKAGSKVRKFVRSKTGRALGKMLKGAARKALPVLGGAVGTVFGGPAGGAIGSRVAGAGGRLFGLELEGLSPEDQEFEVARRVVRLAGESAKNAAVQPPTANPVADAKRAVMKAAKSAAPGIARRPSAPAPTAGGLRRSGRWMRRGRKIVLMGV